METAWGEVMNTGEKRLVLHQLTRGRALSGLEVKADGVAIHLSTSVSWE